MKLWDRNIFGAEPFSFFAILAIFYILQVTFQLNIILTD